MKKNLLIAFIALVTTFSANASVKNISNIIKRETTNPIKHLFKPQLIYALTTTDHCSDGTVYVIVSTVWRMDDGSLSSQTQTFGTECPIPPPGS